VGADDDRPDPDGAEADAVGLYDPALMPADKMEALRTTAEKHVRWRRASNLTLRLEDVIARWAERTLARGGLRAAVGPFVLVGGEEFRPATARQIADGRKKNARPFEYHEVLAIMGKPVEQVMAARVLSAVALMRRSRDSLNSKLDPEGQDELMKFLHYAWVMADIFSEFAVTQENSKWSAGLKGAMRKRRWIKPEEADAEFRRAEELRRQGHDEVAQAKQIEEETGRNRNSVRDRLRKRRGKAKRRPLGK
jgi:hypothetical protein